MTTMTTALGRLTRPARSTGAGAARAVSAGAGGFRLLCFLLVAAAITTVLVLNTARAENSYVQERLDAQATLLHDQKATLAEQVADRSSTQGLAEAARKLDMVPSTSTATLRLSDGSITGVASLVENGRSRTVDLPATGTGTPEDD